MNNVYVNAAGKMYQAPGPSSTNDQQVGSAVANPAGLVLPGIDADLLVDLASSSAAATDHITTHAAYISRKILSGKFIGDKRVGWQW